MIGEQLTPILSFLKRMASSYKFIDMANAEKYEKLVISLDELTAYLEPYYKADEDGNLPLITLDAKSEMLKKYQGVIDNAEEIMKSEGKSELMATFQRFSGMILKEAKFDIMDLNSMDKPSDARKIFMKGRVKDFDVTDVKVKNTGELFTEYTPVNAEKSKEDFSFSFKDTFSVKKKKEVLNAVYRRGYSNLSWAFSGIINDEQYSSIPSEDIYFGNGGFKLDKYYEDLKEKANINYKLAKKKGIKGKQLEKIGNGEKSFALNLKSITEASAVSRLALVDCVYSSYRLQHTHELFEKHIGAQHDEDINDRANAMSYFSKMTGLEYCLAQSEKRNIVNHSEGKYEQQIGTVRNKPKGITLSGIKPEDRIRRNESACETAGFKKSISDLQVMDYICGNIERTKSNVRYIIKDGLFTGVEGVNNITSFALDELKTPFRTACGLSGLGVIDEETARKLQSLSPSMLKFSLNHFDISPEALDAAAKRLVSLQKALENAPVYKEGDKLDINPEKADGGEIKITIIPKDMWEKVKLSELSTGEKSYFSTLVSPVKDILKADDKEYKNSLIIENIENKKKAGLSRASALTSAHRGNITIQDLAGEMKKATSFFRGSSDAYKSIQKNLEKIDLMTENFMVIPGSAAGEDEGNAWHGGGDEYSDKARKNIYYSDKMKKDYLKILNDTKEMADAYLKSKEGKKNNSYTLKRMDVVSRLSTALNRAYKNVEEKLRKTDALDKAAEDLDAFIENLSASKEKTENIAEKLKKDTKKGVENGKTKKSSSKEKDLSRDNIVNEIPSKDKK